MGNRITALLPYNNLLQPINVFGYSTNGIPGLELVGLKTQSRRLKEKIIFLTRNNGHKIPLKRFVLCLESPPTWKWEHDSHWLELPLLTLYWSLAGIIPITKLDDCHCSGTISLEGDINTFPFESENFNLNKLEKSKMKLFCSTNISIDNVIPLPIDVIFKDKF